METTQVGYKAPENRKLTKRQRRRQRFYGYPYDAGDMISYDVSEESVVFIDIIASLVGETEQRRIRAYRGRDAQAVSKPSWSLVMVLSPKLCLDLALQCRLGAFQWPLVRHALP